MMEAIKIHSYRPELAPYFLSINKQWIEHYFALEAFDREQLENPDKSILDKGGQVWFAEWQNEIVGTVAMKKVGDNCFELIKMGVLPKAQGKNIGLLLGHAAIDWARSVGASSVVLYSNSVLAPAIRLYRKMGFVEVPIEMGKYDRCDIKMEIVL